MRQLSQIATILLQNATVITKSDVCHKLRQYTVHPIEAGWLRIINNETEVKERRNIQIFVITEIVL